MFPVSGAAQKITSLQTTAKGQGTLNISDIDKHKITSVLVILKENGEAELTLYTELQLAAKGTWSVGKTLSQGVDLKITGGIVNGGGTGTGKLLLRRDGKSIKKLTSRVLQRMAVRSLWISPPPIHQARLNSESGQYPTGGQFFTLYFVICS